MLWGLSAFFIALALVYLASVFYFRNKITKEAQKIREKKKELSPIVSEFLFYDENGDKIEKINYIGLKIEVRELIKSPFDRKVLTEILLDLRKDVSGNTRKELFHIYQDLGLHEDAYKKLKSWRWQIISKGIFELTQMQVDEAYKPITRFINDKRPTVRKQAEIAVVTLNKGGISFFLDHTRYKISEWQQLKLLDVVRNKVDYLPPPFRLWLTSKNNHVVLFALRLIKHYNQNDANASLITLLRHKNNQIKREAIHCIKEFFVTEALPTLKQLFWNSNVDIKMHILDTIAEIGSAEDVAFLQSIEESDGSFLVKNKAVRAINTITPEAVLPTKDIDTSTKNYENETKETRFPADEIKEKEEADSSEIIATDLKTIEETSVLAESDEDHNKSSVLEDITVRVDPIVNKNDLNEETMDLNANVDLTDEEISFLPFVIDDESETVGTTSHNSEKSVDQIEVDFESVEVGTDRNAFDLNFLPLVVQKSTENKIDLLNLPVVYEVETIVIEEKPLELNALEVVYEELKPLVEIEPEEEKLDLLDFSGIGESIEEDISDESDSEEYLEWPLDFEKIGIEEEAETIKKEETILKESTLDQRIPKPSFHEHLETMSLLENIEELGDEREIPLLKSLMESETSSSVLERIGTILDRFTQRNKIQEKEEEQDHSVFEELIYKSDLDSKLFLLNEIAELGDDKELYLLHRMVSDENKLVRETALNVLQALQERLDANSSGLDKSICESSSSIEELIKKDQPDFFELDFEPAVSAEESLKPKNQTDRNVDNKGTLFDHLCNISTKFYNRKNG